MQTNFENVLAQVRDRLDQNDLAGAAALIESLRSPDQADLFAELDEAARKALLPRLVPGDSADILEELEDEEAARLVDSLALADLARIVDEMEPDEAADLLAELDEAQVSTILSRLEDPNEVRPLLVHPQDSAGGLMTSSHLALRRRMTVADALAAIRTLKPDSEEIYQLFVVDQFGKLVGEVTFRQLVMADPNALLQDVMDPDVLAVPVGTDQEEVARLVSRYDLLALPVVDNGGLLVGVITVDDVVDVLYAEATEDIQRLGGMEPLEQAYFNVSMPLIVRKRIGWLLFLFVADTLTGTVLRAFEDELAAAVALSFFIPLIIGTGGNTGSQTVTTIVRALALGEVRLRDIVRVIWRESAVGLMLGILLGVVGFIRALTWQTGPNIALVVSLTLLVVVVWSNLVAAVVPILAERLRIDPSVVSAPLITSVVDATGLLIYFSLAKLLLGI